MAAAGGGGYAPGRAGRWRNSIFRRAGGCSPRAKSTGYRIAASALPRSIAETRDQAFLATKPHVDFDIEDDSDEPLVGIAITNAGPGPGQPGAASKSPITDCWRGIRSPGVDREQWSDWTNLISLYRLEIVG
jgi:hypothetical protein